VRNSEAIARLKIANLEVIDIKISLQKRQDVFGQKGAVVYRKKYG
jgi:hypothetical protein